MRLQQRWGQLPVSCLLRLRSMYGILSWVSAAASGLVLFHPAWPSRTDAPRQIPLVERIRPALGRWNSTYAEASHARDRRQRSLRYLPRTVRIAQTYPRRICIMWSDGTSAIDITKAVCHPCIFGTSTMADSQALCCSRRVRGFPNLCRHLSHRVGLSNDAYKPRRALGFMGLDSRL